MDSTLPATVVDELLEPLRLLTTYALYPDRDEVHKLRVRIKRTTARLKLFTRLAGGLQNEKALLTCLKSISRTLSIQRDADVQNALIATLIDTAENKQVKALWLQICNLISAQASDNIPDLNALKKAAMHIPDEIQYETETRIGTHEVRHFLKQQHRHLCIKGREVLHTMDMEKLHKWRKQIKCFYYQQETMTASGSKALIQEKTLLRLGKSLGKIHDLDIMLSYLHSQHASGTLMAGNGTVLVAGKVLTKKIKAKRTRCKVLLKRICHGEKV